MGHLLLHLQVMAGMLCQLQQGRGSGTGDAAEVDAPDSHDIGSVRVLRTLSRMRAFKAQMTSDPSRNCREYTQQCKEELGAEGKPWRWVDVNRPIN